MTTALINGIDLRYELDGSGPEVLVILNGIMMSADSWIDSVKALSKGRRVLRLDFRDQGQSQKMTQPYDVDLHVEDLAHLLNHLEIDKVHLLGLSYGGKVAMLFALAHPDRVEKLILCNTTARVTRHLRSIGESWEEAALTYNGETFFRLAMPFIYSANFYETHWEFLKEREVMFGKLLQKPWFDAYIRLSKSTHQYDILEKIHAISAVTLCIASDQDMVTPLTEMKLIQERISGATFALMPNTGHASCYENRELFEQLVIDFLN